MNCTIELLPADHDTIEAKEVMNMTTYTNVTLGTFKDHCKTRLYGGKVYSISPQGWSGYSYMPTLKLPYEVMTIIYEVEH